MSEQSLQAFVDRLKADEAFKQLAAAFLNDFSADNDSMHEYLACFANEQGYTFDIDTMKQLMVGAKMEDFDSHKAKVARKLAPAPPPRARKLAPPKQAPVQAVAPSPAAAAPAADAPDSEQEPRERPKPLNRPAGPLGKVVNPSKIDGAEGGAKGADGVFDHMYGRIGKRKSKSD